MRRVLVLLVAVVALWSVAGAQPSVPSRSDVMVGFVKFVDPKTLIIIRADGTEATFTLTPKTQIVKEKGGSVSGGPSGPPRRDLMPGDRVRITYDGTRAHSVYVEGRQK